MSQGAKCFNTPILYTNIVVFKSLTISKVDHLTLNTEIPTLIINLLNKIQMEYTWKGKILKIKHSTFCNKCENGGLENVDAFPRVGQSPMLLDKKIV